jgi:arylsulfatase A-like enzyme
MRGKDRPNIVFILLDACRARNLGCYGYGLPTSPNMDRISKEGFTFDNCFSTTNVTDISLSSIFSGLYPDSHGITVQARTEDLVAPGVKFIPEILKENGYRTMAVDWLSRYHKRGYDWYGYFSESARDADVRKSALNVRNFVKFSLPYDRFPAPLKKLIKYFYDRIMPAWYPRWYDAEKTTNTSIKLLEKAKERDDNFFLFVHYWDTHVPYNTTPGNAKRFLRKRKSRIRKEEMLKSFLDDEEREFAKKWMRNAADSDDIISMYDGSISYTDKHIGRIYDFLKKNGMLDDTLIIITSDHGECLLEHGIYFDHHCGLYDEILHVPLIIRYPKKFPRGKRLKHMVQHTDIAPTVLETIGVKWNKEHAGVSLLPSLKGKETRKYSFAVMDRKERYALRDTSYKYIVRNPSAEPKKKYADQLEADEELYDLKADPDELDNVVKKRKSVKKRLEDVLKRETEAWKSSGKPLKEISPKRYEDEEEVKKRLRDLGYLG